MPKRSLKNPSGFTMIELLAVVAMVGILASMVLISVNPKKFISGGNDAKRKNDLNALQTALASYYLDKGEYPLISGSVFSGNATLLSGMTPTYIKSLPPDPSNENCQGYIYVTNSNKNNYDIFVKLEDNTDPDALSTKATPASTSFCTVSLDNKTCATSTPSCQNTTYNYWVGNP